MDDEVRELATDTLLAVTNDGNHSAKSYARLLPHFKAFPLSTCFGRRSRMCRIEVGGVANRSGNCRDS